MLPGRGFRVMASPSVVRALPGPSPADAGKGALSEVLVPLLQGGNAHNRRPKVAVATVAHASGDVDQGARAQGKGLLLQFEGALALQDEVDLLAVVTTRARDGRPYRPVRVPARPGAAPTSPDPRRFRAALQRPLPLPQQPAVAATPLPARFTGPRWPWACDWGGSGSLVWQTTAWGRLQGRPAACGIMAWEANHEGAPGSG